MRAIIRHTFTAMSSRILLSVGISATAPEKFGRCCPAQFTVFQNGCCIINQIKRFSHIKDI
jgi:hypothetical protein